MTKSEINLLVSFVKLGGKVEETDKLKKGESMHNDGTVYVGIANA